MDGKAVRSCMTQVSRAAGHAITTIEGLGTLEKPHRVQAAFIEYDALQCGFCTPGQIMAAVALLGENPNPSEDEVRRGMSGNLCRCGTYPKIVRAVLAAAEPANG
jgi:aerobic-type carbon monoxide dehydrogenase small subunit (CoxS/CutS family)